MSPLATIVVVTWNGAHLLPGCLDSIQAQTLGPDDVRVVVVDNASTDGTAEVLSRYQDVGVIRSVRNLGFAGGATLGLRSASTPYAVVLNNDARPDEDWLVNLLNGFEEGIAAVTSKVLLMPRFAEVTVIGARPEDITSVCLSGRDVTGSVIARAESGGVVLAVPADEGASFDVQVSGAGGQELMIASLAIDTPRFDVLNSTGGVLLPSGHGADRGYLEVDCGQYDQQRDVFGICGAAAAFRTDVGSALGWFDPWFFAYYEDLDFSWRLRRAGWAIRYVPSARVRHEHAATSRVGSDLFLFHNRRNRLATLVRNASLREMTGALATRGNEPSRAVLLTGPESRQAPAPRGKLAPLVSFLAHMPSLLFARACSALGPDLSPGARAWRLQSPPAVDV